MRQLTECADQHLWGADTDLSTRYTAVQKKIEAADQKRLRDAERAQITFHETEWRYGIGGEDQGGTPWPIPELKCWADLAEARIKDIRFINELSSTASAQFHRRRHANLRY
jgi:uncharacterized protein YecT (DUF1311 family)